MLAILLISSWACVPPPSFSRRSAQAAARLASLGFERAVPEAAAAPSGRRDLIVCCHDTPESVVRGRFRLDNLPNGRVDLLARCATAAIFLSHGIRENTRLWLVLQDHGVSLCLDGATARGLHPDERTMAAAAQRTLAVAHGAVPRANSDDGWSFHAGGLVKRLSELVGDGDAPLSGKRRPLIQMHEKGEASLAATLRGFYDLGDAKGGLRTDLDRGAILVLGDQLGFTPEEDAEVARRGGVRATAGPRPLLTSHCIVLAHHACDTVAEAVG